MLNRIKRFFFCSKRNQIWAESEFHGNRNDECVIFVLLIRSAKGRPIYFVKKGVEGRDTISEPNFKSQKGEKKITRGNIRDKSTIVEWVKEQCDMTNTHSKNKPEIVISLLYFRPACDAPVLKDQM
jgi:hypothetical protein